MGGAAPALAADSLLEPQASRRRGQYFTMVFRMPGTKETAATCDATPGPNAQICVLGFIGHDKGISMIDLAHNRLYGTLHEYGPKGGAAAAFKGYKGTSGRFPLVFIVEVTQQNTPTFV